jgi:predicted NAD/FAD-binding protein
VIGGGIAGLSTAWLLAPQHEVTLFEAGSYVGGHTNTIDVTVDGLTHPVDTGFLVFNRRTYPNLCALFALLQVEAVETEMSFGRQPRRARARMGRLRPRHRVRAARNLVRPAFSACCATSCASTARPRAWRARAPCRRCARRLPRHRGLLAGLPRLVPAADGAAIWSCPTRAMLAYPLATFVQFCHNHGLLQIFDRPSWMTVKGGGRSYVRKMLAAWTTCG